MSSDTLFYGPIVHCKSFSDLEIIENGFLLVENGKIKSIGQRNEVPANLPSNVKIIELTENQFLLPGFVDCHIHAPQYPNLGLGLDLPLLEWLDKYTFPLETRYKDENFAKTIYEAVVRRTVASGTTLASYFATNYKNSSIVLAEEVARQGQRAFVGKVSSNCNSPPSYVEKTDESIRETEDFVKKVLQMNNPLVQPIVTPRFAITCDAELLRSLGAIAAKYDVHIQSHICENLNEIAKVKEDFQQPNYATVYERANLLTNKCVMAHGVHLEHKELEILQRNGTSIAHCPTSNTNLGSGICDVRRLLAHNVKVGLGTDVSGGNSPSILTAIKDCLDVSHHLEFFKKQTILGSGKIANPDDEQNSTYIPLNYKNVLFLATLGGAQALAIDKVVGNFEIEKEFDALVVDVGKDPINFVDVHLNDETLKKHIEKLLQKFLYTGDDRNIVQVYVAGNKIKQL